MTGTLGLFSLVDLFQLLAAARRSGRLSIDHPRGPAKVFFDKGQVVHAEFEGISGEEAVYAIFADERGTFEFRVAIPAPFITVKGGTENVILEAVRRIDESRRDEGAAASPPPITRDAVPARSTQADALVAGTATEPRLSAEERLIVEQVDGQRTVTRIAIQAGIEPERAMNVTERLVRTGLLKVQNRRARTARLVVRLTSLRLEPGVVGVDKNIIDAWEKVVGHDVTEIACRREDGTVLMFTLQLVSGAGPFLELTRDTMLRANLAANEPLLARPVVRNQDG
ncbi:MAG TPA: DUF4388 domain-containing protein [Trueperaceae bacterium]|nr:DUF4388 domain-containing protein [Trueperaceae bacterium]